MNLWLRLSANFHEHPKMLAVRKEAGSRADSAELGWYRILMAAKRYGRWSFASEEHLAHVAGPYYRWVALYRKHRLLDDLTVHDGETYNAVKTPAERKAEQRERDEMSREDVTSERDMPRDTNVTLDKRDRENKESTENYDGRDDLEAFLEVSRRAPSEKQRRFLDQVLDAHDVTGPAWSAAIIRANPDDPIGAVIREHKAWKAGRNAEADIVEAESRRRHSPSRGPSKPAAVRDLLNEWAKSSDAA